MTRAFAASALWLSLSAGSLNGQGTITGIVVDDYTNEPLQFGYVSLYPDSIPSTSIDSLGHFVLRGVPPGDHVLSARSLGYEYDLRFVSLAPGDSVDVEFRLGQAVSLINVEMPVPEGALLAAARMLLPRVRAHPHIRELVRTLADPEQDTLVVWIPWTTGVSDTTVVDESVQILTSECDGCVAETFYTFEGLKYRPGMSHVVLGVFPAYTKTPMLRYCVFRESQLSDWNCTSHVGDLSFAQWPNGTWKIVPN